MENENSTLILSFCNFDYVKVALNWVEYLNKLEINNYLIVALDSETETFLKDHNVNTKLIKGEIPKRSGKGWRWRFQQTYEFVKDGYNVIHSDLDAVWLKNPLDIIDTKYDIIASTDTGGFPPETYQKWNFTMCMGWMYYASTNATLNLFESILKNKKNFDDQMEFNNYISDKVGIRDIYIKMDGSKKIQIDNAIICVLNENVIKRSDYDENAFVCHPLMKKKADCEIQLKRRGLWCE
jgi:hypothetical protein